MKDLIETSDTIFTGSTPTLRQIGILRQKLNKCSLADLGYTQDSLKSAMLKPYEWREFHLNSMPPHVIPVHSTSGYHVVAFVLPHQSCLGLHDHSGMLVLSSVLMGGAHVTTYHLRSPLNDLSDSSTCVDEAHLTKHESTCAIKRNYAVLREKEMITFKKTSASSSRHNSDLNEDAETEIDAVDLLNGYGKEPQDTKLSGNLFLCEKVFDGDIVLTKEEFYAEKEPDLAESERPAGTGIERDITFDADATGGSPNETIRSAMTEGKHHRNLPNTSMGRTFCYKRMAQESFYDRRSAIVLPSICNIHEIRSTDELTVMLDILSPPYGPKRECRYFRVINTDNITGDPELRVLERCEYGGPDYFHELPFLGEFS
eukprot:GHVS01070893.1.p1 GENE.GHVS01070893.1~~GHVS01070893.1.p1  ORF type:complete len:397 (+),score=22.38 GHVS01070893.1:77-1192(+)